MPIYPPCPLCSSPVTLRRKSKRVGELLFICDERKHKLQAVTIHGHIHYYTTGKFGVTKKLRSVRTTDIAHLAMKADGESEQSLLDWAMRERGYTA